MPIKPCRECGKDVSTAAAACPSCGKKRPTQTAKQMLIGCAVLAAMMVGCLSLFVSSVRNIDPPTEAEKRETQKSIDSNMAVMQMQDHVKQLLKSPSTAEFPSLLFGGAAKHATAEGGGVFRVKSYVDSENGFGAMMRTNYFGRIKKMPGDTWQVTELVTE